MSAPRVGSRNQDWVTLPLVCIRGSVHQGGLCAGCGPSAPAAGAPHSASAGPAPVRPGLLIVLYELAEQVKSPATHLVAIASAIAWDRCPARDNAGYQPGFVLTGAELRILPTDKCTLWASRLSENPPQCAAQAAPHCKKNGPRSKTEPPAPFHPEYMGRGSAGLITQCRRAMLVVRRLVHQRGGLAGGPAGNSPVRFIGTAP